MRSDNDIHIWGEKRLHTFPWPPRVPGLPREFFDYLRGTCRANRANCGATAARAWYLAAKEGKVTAREAREALEQIEREMT